MEKIKIIGVLLTSGWLAFGGGQDKMRLFFDIPYPVAPYAQALDTCVQLCADFDECAYTTNDAQRELLGDAILGKAVRIRIAVDALITDFQQGSQIVFEDRAFLEHALGRIADRYHEYAGSNQDTLLQEVFSSLALRVRTLTDHT